MSQELKETVESLSLFAPQNPEVFYQRAEKAAAEDRPIRFGCFVCLPSEWLFINKRLTYKVGTDPTKLSRLETPQFIDRSLEILCALDTIGVPFRWDFIVADTDPKDVFGDILEAEPQPAIDSFRDRINRSLAQAILPEATATPLWSNIQRPYQVQYEADYNRLYNSKEIKEDIETGMRVRLDYYMRFFANQGLKVKEAMLIPICRIVARKNRSLYGAQGPIIDREYDCLVIGDRDPRRLGSYQSILIPNLSIWYPYPGG